MKTARFWTYHHGYVKISLRPGQTLNHTAGGIHEEGWWSESTTWRHDGDTVVCQHATDGADCDGRLSTHNETFCPLDRLTAREPFDRDGLPARAMLPEWERGESGQRDYAAEAMGY